MAYGEIDKRAMTVTMSMEEYEFYSDAAQGRDDFVRMFKRANQNGKAVMTEELKKEIEEIYC